MRGPGLAISKQLSGLIQYSVWSIQVFAVNISSMFSPEMIYLGHFCKPSHPIHRCLQQLAGTMLNENNSVA